MSTNIRKSCALTATAILVSAVVSANPPSVSANRAHDAPTPADSLGIRYSEPDAQHIQDEVNLVRSQGLPIRIVAHKIIPTLVDTARGQRVLATNVPAVEFEIGRMPGETWQSLDATGTSAAPSFARHAFRAETLGPATIGNRQHHADYADSFSYQDTANGSAGGYPSFYWTAHFDQTSSTDGSGHVYYTNYTTHITHRAENANASSGASFIGGAEDVACNASSFPGYFREGGSGGSWSVEYSDNFPAISCANGSTYVYVTSLWSWHNTSFRSDWNNTTSVPGDYVRY